MVYNHCFDYLNGGVHVFSSGNYSNFNKYYNYYYSSSGHGVHFIKEQSGSTFQDKAVNYVVNTLKISKDRVSAFQNAMLQ